MHSIFDTCQTLNQATVNKMIDSQKLKCVFLNENTSIIKGLKGIPAYYYHSVTTELETIAKEMVTVGISVIWPYP